MSQGEPRIAASDDAPGVVAGSISAELHAPGPGRSLGAYGRETWRLRHFIRSYALGRMRASRADMLLGSLWFILEPAAIITVYYLVFEVIFSRGSGVGNFIGFLAIGQMLFAAGKRSVQRVATSLSRNEQMLRSFTFPHIVFPIADLIDVAISLCYTLAVAVVLLIATGETVTLAWLWIFPIIAVELVIGFGIGLICARAFARATDLVVIMENIFRGLLFLSGVFWSLDRIAQGPHEGLILRLLTVNPIYCCIQLGRWALMGMRPAPVGWMLGSLAVWLVAAVSFGALLFYRGEKHHSGSFRVKRER